MKRFLIVLTAICSIAFLYLYCSSAPVASTGGSSTETIGGRLVDTLNNPVNGAMVRVASVDTTISSEVFWDITNSDGDYLIENIDSGTYNLLGFTLDSSLVISIDSINYINDKQLLDLGTDTMHAPGSISGQVLLDGKSKAGVLIYIPGTSFAAYSDDDGSFVMNYVPEGIYKVYYAYPGYITGIDSGVQVLSGSNTVLAPKNLLPNPDDEPPAPSFLFAEYDTAAGVVALKWEKVTVSDLLCYYVYRKEVDDTTTIEKIGTAYDSLYYDTVFSDLLDTLAYNLKYQVKSVDTLTNESSFSPAADILAASPTAVRTFFRWTLIPDVNDTTTIGDSVALAVDFTNKTRKNILIRWYMGDPLDTVRVVNVNVKAGSDTLIYSFQDSGMHKVRIEALDEKGCVWRDSGMVSVNEIIPSDTWDGYYPLLHNRKFHGAIVINNTIYTAGGAEDLFIGFKWVPTALASMESFSFGDSSWSSFATMPTARFDAAVVSVSEKLYVIGGRKEDLEYETIEIYNTQSNTWESALKMPSVRFGHAACVINDSIYIFGGITKIDGKHQLTSSVDIFDPSTGALSSKDTMIVARAYHQVVVINNVAYILGGTNDLTTAEPLKSVEVYNISRGTIAQAHDMLHARMHFGATLLNGKIYAVGGFESTGNNTFLSSMEAYDPSSDTWIEKKPLPSARHSFAICTYNNIMYVIGGSEKGYPNLGQLGSVLRYYP